MIDAQSEKLETRETAIFALVPASTPQSHEQLVRIAQAALPHAAMICIHSVEHSFGYEIAQIICTGVPKIFIDTITTHRKNIRSEIFSRLISSDGMIYLEASGLTATDRACLSEFQHTGYTNLIGYMHRTSDDIGRMTAVVFFDIDKSQESHFAELKQALMPFLHTILRVSSERSSTRKKDSDARQCPIFTTNEQSVAKLVVQGMQDKEIARLLNMTERMAKQYVTNLRGKMKAKNRTALAVALHIVL